MRTIARILPLLLLLGTARADHKASLVHLTTRPWLTLDPARAFDAVSLIVVANVYEPLLAFKDVRRPDELSPFLASEVPARENGLLSADGLTYTFPIRQGVRFHDGEPLTAEDVRYSILRFMLSDPEGGPAAMLLKPILGVYKTRDDKGRVTVDFAEASRAVRVEDGKVVVTLKKPHASFLKVLASWPIVMSRKWAAAHGEWDGSERTWKAFNNKKGPSHLRAKMNGTGPYRLGGTAHDDTHLILERHAGYWREPAKLGSVLLKVVPSKALRMWMLENGDADGAYFEDRDYHEAREVPGVRVQDGLPCVSIGEVLFFTFSIKPDPQYTGSGKWDGQGVPSDFFADPHIRRGFAYAFDYERYLREGLGGRGTRAPGPFPDHLMRPEMDVRYRYDAEKAASEFKKAHGGRAWEKGFTLTIAFSPSNASRQAMAEILRESLARINPKFKLKIRALPGGPFYQAVEEGRLPAFISGYYADYPDLQSFAFGMLHSAGYYPKGQRFSNQALDKLIERAEGAADSKERDALYLEIEQMTQELVPQVYFYSPTRFSAYRKEVRGADSTENIANLALNSFPYFYSLSK